jgi:hypothetical protein
MPSSPRNWTSSAARRCRYASPSPGTWHSTDELNAEQFRAYVTVGAGYCDFIEDPEGRTVAIPKSVSFAKMSDDEFERLYNDTLTFICKQWAMDQDQINQIVEFM